VPRNCGKPTRTAAHAPMWRVGACGDPWLMGPPPERDHEPVTRRSHAATSSDCIIPSVLNRVVAPALQLPFQPPRRAGLHVGRVGSTRVTPPSCSTPAGVLVTPSPHRTGGREELVGIVGWPQETNDLIVEAWREQGIAAGMLSPSDARLLLGRNDVAIGRFDVRETLDGVQPGLEVLAELDRDGIRVINGVDALLNAHDKLRTACLLGGAGLPHPTTVHVTAPDELVDLEPPVVVKPRFGSWGTDVYRCETRDDLARTLVSVSDRPWFVRHGALVQELVPPIGYDLRIVVAAGRVVGATERVARPGEWRTNVALGGTRRPTRPSEEARALGVTAAGVIGADLIGVDLLPASGGYLVLELNGAVEFDRAYDIGGSNVFTEAAIALGLPRLGHRPKPKPKLSVGRGPTPSRPRSRRG